MKTPLMKLISIKQFQIVTSKHKDCTERLEQIDPDLALEVRQILDKNKQERHIRGGLATKAKYEKASSAAHPYSFLF